MLKRSYEKVLFQMTDSEPAISHFLLSYCVTKFSQISKLQNARLIKRNTKITALNIRGRLK